MSELEQMTKEELLEEYKDLLDDNAWWNRRWKAENHRANNLQQRIDKAIENCKKSIESINQKLQDDKTIKVVDGKVANMNEYQIIRLKAIRMKCKELLAILGDKE